MASDQSDHAFKLFYNKVLSKFSHYIVRLSEKSAIKSKDWMTPDLLADIREKKKKKQAS